MAIEAISITSRISAYSCCAANEGYNWIIKESLGDPCWKESRRRYRFLSWAMGILSQYPLDDDPCGCEGCVTEDFVNQVIALADPGCVKCACAQTFPPVDPCTVIPNYTVLAAIPDTDVGAAPDGTYLLTVISGTPVAIIVTVSGGVYSIQFAVNDGLIVYATTTTTFYSAFQNVTTLLYPGITVGTVIAPNLYDIISDNAPYAFAQNRDIVIEAFDGTDWLAVYTGTEQEIAINLTISTAGIVDNPTNFRIKYFIGTCQYGPVDATVFNTTPPFTNVIVTAEAVFPSSYPATIQQGEVMVALATAASVAGTGSDNNFDGLHKASDDATKFVAGSSFGAMRYSWDAGATWATPAGNWASSPDIPDINEAHFTQFSDDGVGTYFVAGEEGVLARSLDYGATFDWIDQSGITGDVRSVGAAGGQDEFVVGTELNGIWRTDDGGATWAQVLNITDEVQHIQVIGTTILAFTPVGCYRSLDAGLTFPSFPNTGVLGVIDSFVMSPVVIAAGAGGRYKSTDDGQTWQQQGINACLSASMLSAQIYLYVEDSNNVTISINGGITTVPMNIGTSQGYAWKVRGYIYP